jgi:hypothetical protein
MLDSSTLCRWHSGYPASLCTQHPATTDPEQQPDLRDAPSTVASCPDTDTLCLRSTRLTGVNGRTLIVERNCALWNMAEIRSSQVISHCGPGAGGVDVRGATLGPNIVDMDGAEINTVPGFAGGVGHRRM